MGGRGAERAVGGYTFDFEIIVWMSLNEIHIHRTVWYLSIYSPTALRGRYASYRPPSPSTTWTGRPSPGRSMAGSIIIQYLAPKLCLRDE